MTIHQLEIYLLLQVRYVKNTSDIINKFGTSFDSIVEIGGGY